MHTAPLFSPLPDDDTLYAALLARDPAYDGFAFVGVKSTGVFCRLTCPARKPRRENTQFFDSIKGCVEAGFRPCLRCRPLERVGAQEPLVSDLLQRLGRQPQRRWFENDLAALGYDPSTVRRAFKRQFGVTFLEMARLRRLGQGAERLSSGARVIDAQLDASFDSDSGFRSAFARLLGEPPSQLRGRELLKADWLQTPLGAMLAVADAQALHLLEFFDRPALGAKQSACRRAAARASASVASPRSTASRWSSPTTSAAYGRISGLLWRCTPRLSRGRSGRPCAKCHAGPPGAMPGWPARSARRRRCAP